MSEVTLMIFVISCGALGVYTARKQDAEWILSAGW